MVLQFTGKNCYAKLKHESGGHRFQRIPPTERKGRVHTSTITVAILPVPSERDVVLLDKDLQWSFCRAGGSGGQHVNKTDSAVQLTHIPTGLQIRCEAERSQTQNKVTALALLRARIQEQTTQQNAQSRNADRKAQVGGGARGDKTITLRLQEDQVVHHETGKRTTATRYMAGYLEDLI